jgi:hypothetical protein
MKFMIIAAALIGSISVAKAQSSYNASGNAPQSVQLSLGNTLEITFTSNNNASGTTVDMAFSALHQLMNGLESVEQEFRIRSNKHFTVTVKTNSAYFNSSGGSSNSVQMPVSVLGLIVAQNNTGGELGQGFSASAYKPLSDQSVSLITGGVNGGDQTFAVKYRAAPGYDFTAGTYSTDVVYTATQM